MYNSYVVGFLVKIWEVFAYAYEGSLVKKVMDGIKKFLSFIFTGSRVKEIFTKDNHSVKKSLFYRIYSWITKLYGNIWSKINRYVKRIGKTSFTYKTIQNMFKDDIEVTKTISTFIFFFSMIVFIKNLLRGYFLGRINILSIILIVCSLIVIFIGDNIKEVLNNSYVYRFIESLFTIDEGGERWW